MKEIVILALSGSGVLGGGETLYMRMVRWLRGHDYRTMVMYNQSADFTPSLLAFFEEYGLERIVVPDLSGRADMPDFTKANVELPAGSLVKIICIQSPFNFFAAQMLQHRLKGCRCDVIHYIIHENDYCRNLSQRVSNPLLLSLFRLRYRNLVERMEQNGNIAYMMEDYLKHVHETLGVRETAEPVIMRLGMEVAEYDEEKNRRRFRKDVFTVVGTARLDFPFKGFLVGLVDEFEKVLADEPKTELIIIGDGPGREELGKKVAESTAAGSIRMIGAVPYDLLPEYLNNANLYISMGTGPLDAANTGLISIAVNAYTYECLTTGYWCDDFTNLGFNGTIPAHEYILKTIRMSEEEYLVLARRTYDVLRQNYGMDTFMQRMLEQKNVSDKPLLSRGYLRFTCFVRKMMNFVTK